jgi:hypothetical protein
VIVGSGDHRISLAGSDWTLWRWLVLRGSGFPANLLDELADVPAADAVAKLLSREDTADVARTACIQALEGVIETLSGDERKQVGKALKRLRQGGTVSELGHATEELARLAAALAGCEEARVAAEQALTSGEREISSALQRVAGDPLFREACVWQNRSAIHTAIDRIRDGRSSNANQHRQHEQLVARYLQRYAAKNDTIGFFGPVVWGSFVTDANEARARPGNGLLSSRTVYFEHWGLDSIARSFDNDFDRLVNLAPRRAPTIRIIGDELHHGQGSTPLPPELAAILRACDGVRTAREVAAHVLQANAYEVSSEDEILELLADLRENRLVYWGIELPAATAFPERSLRAALQQIGAPTEALDELEGARRVVAEAAGRPDALHQALDSVDEVFQRVTGKQANRRAGEMYAGRTLVYEDCRRAYDLKVGKPFLDRLGPALSIVLEGARWYTWEVGARFYEATERTLEALRTETGSEVIDFGRYFERIFPFVPQLASETDVANEVIVELGKRWASLLDLDLDARRVSLSSAALRPRAAEIFAAPCPGWPIARYHSPDVMIAARSSDDLLAGRGLVVLGEMHTGRSTLTIPLFLKESDVANQVLHADRTDVTGHRVRQVLSKSRAIRPDFGPTHERDFDVELGDTASQLPRDRVLAVADLVVTRRANRTVVETRDGAHSFDAIVFFESFLQVGTQARWEILGPLPHTPRVQIDDVVIIRETWRFAPDALAAVIAAPRGLPQFVVVARWAKQRNLPRRVFVKIPEEVKPVYIDFASPILVEIFAKLARKATRMTVSEMLPDCEELWLADATGKHYTAELRITAVDPESWRPG